MFQKIKQCRVCGNRELVLIMQLGSFKLTGVFPKTADQAITSGPLELVKCDERSNSRTCGLLQLNHSYDLNELYGAAYGYRSGINRTMREHLKRKAAKILENVTLEPGDIVVDIGSNDGTLLNCYEQRQDIVFLGIDPSAGKYREYYPKTTQLIVDFFSADLCKSLVGKSKAKIITSIAMFYDLEQPLRFIHDISEILGDNGVWVIEQSYMPTMIKRNAYDTICHEHLEYYGLRQIHWMAEKCGLRILEAETNDINGGSFSVTLVKKHALQKSNSLSITKMLDHEKSEGFDQLEPYIDFKSRIYRHREELIKTIKKAKSDGLLICGYGASTKGNVILQFCGFDSRHICAIAERNPDKFGLYTPGTHIPIISEEEARKLNPDYFLVMPWHFRDEIIERETSFVMSGGKLLFPLPIIEIAEKKHINAKMLLPVTDKV